VARKVRTARTHSPASHTTTAHWRGRWGQHTRILPSPPTAHPSLHYRPAPPPRVLCPQLCALHL
jgi:hypothetical protein